MAGRAATDAIIRGRCAISVNDPGHPTPPGWRRVSLLDVADLGTGHTPSRNHPEYWDGDVAWIGIRDAAANHGGVIDDTAQHITDEGLANSAARLLPKDTVCLSRTASVGYVVKMGRDMATSQDFVTWTCGQALEPDFLMKALLAEGDAIRNFGEGSTHTTIYFPEVKALHIDLPPLAEQRRIVAKLDALHARLACARAELDRIPTLADNLRQQCVSNAFDGSLTEDWRAFNEGILSATDDELSHAYAAETSFKRKKPVTEIDWRPAVDLPRSWRWVSIDQLVAEVQYGSSAKTSLDDSGVPVLRMGNIQRGKIDWTDLKYLPKDHDEFPNLLLREGDVVFNRTNSFELVGKTAAIGKLDRPASFASYLIKLRPIGMPAELLAYYLNSLFARRWVDQVASQQVGQANVNGSKLKALGIPLPPTECQSAPKIDP